MFGCTAGLEQVSRYAAVHLPYLYMRLHMDSGASHALCVSTEQALLLGTGSW